MSNLRESNRRNRVGIPPDRPHLTMATVFLDTPDNDSIPAVTVIPVLQYTNVAAAVQWLCAAFGFSERLRIGTHRVQLNVGSGAVVVADRPSEAPRPSGQSVMVRVHDVDALCKRASELGADILRTPESHPYGERQCTVRDVGGHVWTFSQSIANVAPASWGGEMIAPRGTSGT